MTYSKSRLLDRRQLLRGALAVGAAACTRTVDRTGDRTGDRAPAGEPAPAAADPRAAAFARLEREHGGRLGVAVLDLATGRSVAHRGDERFPFCSTCKTVAAAATLHRVDRGEERLDRRIAYTEADLLDHAPVARAHLARGALTVGELCEAAIVVSDNTAGNLLFRELGGMAALTAYARTLGDPVTRFDRTEPSLNEAIAGDPRDTTSPSAMVGNLRALMLGDALAATSRDQLIAWHLATETGKARLRAGLPATWKLAHKTGTGQHGATNDIGIVWPPARPPLIVAVYYVDSPAPAAAREAVLASVAQLVAGA